MPCVLAFRQPTRKPVCRGHFLPLPRCYVWPIIYQAALTASGCRARPQLAPRRAAELLRGLRKPGPGQAWPWRWSGRRLDVRIEAEEIVRVVLLFQRGQPLIVGAVGGGHALLVILAEIVDIDAAGEGMKRAPAVAGPRHVLGGVRRVEPLRDGDRRVRKGARTERRRIGGDSPCGSEYGLNEHPR